MGWHVAKIGDRYAAAHAVGMAVKTVFGVAAGGIARGVALRHDHGSPFMADHFRNQNRNTAAANRQLACCDCFAVSKEPGPVHLQQVLADQRAKAAALVVEAAPVEDEAANLEPVENEQEG